MRQLDEAGKRLLSLMSEIESRSASAVDYVGCPRCIQHYDRDGTNDACPPLALNSLSTNDGRLTPLTPVVKRLEYALTAGTGLVSWIVY